MATVLKLPKSHPMWVRGLKQQKYVKLWDTALVAPYVGAWIETLHITTTNITAQSHPMWVRGLKPVANVNWQQSYPESHPMWVRGLKLHC